MANNKFFRALVLSAVTFSAASISVSALADTIELNNFWAGNTWDTSISFTGTNYHDGSSASFVEGGGAGGFKTYDLTTDPGRAHAFQSWCVDIFHDFYFPSQSSDVLTSASSIFGTTKANDLGRLATNHYADVASTGTSGLDSAAFQLAVWEIVNEGTGNLYDVGSGNLKLTGSAASLAQTWLGELNSTPSVSKYSVNIWEIQGDGPSGWGSQDVAVFAPVPEPETYAMLMAGIGLLGAVARRRKQQAA